MKYQKQCFFIAILLCLAVACSQKHKEAPAEMQEEPVSEMAPYDAGKNKMVDESSASAPLSSAAAVEKSEDTKHKFIRTADIRFKVKDVIRATYQIEDIAVRQGGFVTNSTLKSETYTSETKNISKDSALLVTKYTTYSMLTLRVPNVNLDATLKEIAPLVEYLDSRQVTADDVAIHMYANNLTQQRLNKNQGRLENAINNRGRKLEETTTAEELLLQSQENADNAKVSNLMLSDQVSYSTISIHIYQNESIKKEIIEREKSIEEYKPGLGSRMQEALSGGWDLVCYLIVLISYMWGFILAGILIYVGFRYYKRYKKNKENS